MSLLTDEELCQHGTIGIRNTRLFPDTNYFNTPFDSLLLYHDPILDRSYRLVTIDTAGCFGSIKPHKKSLRYKGQIYLLHDRESFSAANSFVTFALSEEKLIAVGEPTGRLGGYGITPSVYQLPITNVSFVMHSSIHIPYNGQSVDDYLWNKTEVPVTSTPEHESFIGFWWAYDIFSKDYLFNQDPFFRKALEQKNR